MYVYIYMYIIIYIYMYTFDIIIYIYIYLCVIHICTNYIPIYCYTWLLRRCASCSHQAQVPETTPTERAMAAPQSWDFGDASHLVNW